MYGLFIIEMKLNLLAVWCVSNKQEDQGMVSPRTEVTLLSHLYVAPETLWTKNARLKVLNFSLRFRNLKFRLRCG